MSEELFWYGKEIICKCGHNINLHHSGGCGYQYPNSSYCGCLKTNIELFRIAVDALTAERDVLAKKVQLATVFVNFILDTAHPSTPAFKKAKDILMEFHNIDDAEIEKEDKHDTG
jgi:hypothetical protein